MLAASTGEFSSFQLSHVPTGSWLARVDRLLAGAGLPDRAGSILALSAYSVAVRRLPTSTVATYPYVNPVVAVILGATLLNERLTPTMLIGGALIIVAVALVVWRGAAPPVERPCVYRVPGLVSTPCPGSCPGRCSRPWPGPGPAEPPICLVHRKFIK